MASELGERRQVEQIDSVFCSDLRRAVETAEIAFPGIPVHPDRRLREYDYGAMTRSRVEQIHAERAARVDIPFPEGESLRDVATRVGEFLDGQASDWDSKRVLLIGHAATKLALDHVLGG